MILEDATKEVFGYYATDLSDYSPRPIITVCEFSNEFKVVCRFDYQSFYHLCYIFLRKNDKIKKDSILGWLLTEETKSKIHTGKRGNICFYGHKWTEEAKALISVANKGENNGNWKGGISFEPYCIKFDEEYKSYVRNLFGNECFLCSKTEPDNGRKLSVHHVNYNKDCGCDETKCLCVPLCIRCHVKTNTNRDFWQYLIIEMLKPLEAWIN